MSPPFYVFSNLSVLFIYSEVLALAYIVQPLVVGLSRCKAQATKAVATEVRFLAATAGQGEYNYKIKGKTFLDISL